MEVDSEKIVNNENHGRVLRRRKKKTSYSDRVVKRRTNNVPRKRTRRHRSLDLPKKNKLKDSLGLRPSTSNSSLKSVIYLGYYRKVPQLIILDDNSDSAQNQSNHQEYNQLTECQNASTSSSPKDKDGEQTLDQLSNNSWNETQDTNNLLNLLSEMCVGATYKRIVTRARTRGCKINGRKN